MSPISNSLKLETHKNYTMRKIESRLIAAIKSGENFSLSNTTLRWINNNQDQRVGVVELFGNVIARIHENEVELFDAFWQSKTTKSRLNAIIQGLELGRGIYQKNFDWFLVTHNGEVPWIHSVVLDRYQSDLTSPELLEKLAVKGYSDPFLNDGLLWAFPHNAVMAVPV